jgi:hypothetical protein
VDFPCYCSFDSWDVLPFKEEKVNLKFLFAIANVVSNFDLNNLQNIQLFIKIVQHNSSEALRPLQCNILLRPTRRLRVF